MVNLSWLPILTRPLKPTAKFIIFIMANEIVHIAKAAGLLAIPIDGNVFALKGLPNEVPYYP